MIDDEVLAVVFPHLKDVVVDAVGLRGQVVQIGAHRVGGGRVSGVRGAVPAGPWAIRTRVE